MKTRKGRLSASAMVVTTILFTVPQTAKAQEAVPLLINYQGELRSPATGQPVPDGSYSMVFRIYNDPEDTSPKALLWTGAYMAANGNPVQITGGVLSVILGSGAGNALGEAVFEEPDRWLEIEVAGETLEPRQRMTSVAYSIVSENSRYLGGKSASDLLTRAQADARYWSLAGSAGTTPATNFLGTTDDQPLELHVNGTRALRLEPAAASPNIIGGHSSNSVTAGVAGAMIGGGSDNTASETYATVGGGAGNTASARYATVGGGKENTASARYATVGGGGNSGASGDYATVGGGGGNTASAYYATVGGGFDNTASGGYASVAGGWYNTASESYATVGGGDNNEVTADYGTIAGGGRSDPKDPATANRVTDSYGTVGGGGNNQAGDAEEKTDYAQYATVGGGRSNTGSGQGATVGGGRDNTASEPYATVGGGWGNDASDGQATVGGGRSNDASGGAATVGGGGDNIASGGGATIGGGVRNTAGGQYATVGGGENNEVTADYGTIAGGGRSDPGDAATANRVTDSYATVGGGGNNRAGDGVETSDYGKGATVAGGWGNTASNTYATVGGGDGNTASGWEATVAGGADNTASGYCATVGGGFANTASGDFATVGGGWDNTADGDYSFAAGYHAKANHKGSFVLTDSTDADFASARADALRVRFKGGTTFVVNDDYWVRFWRMGTRVIDASNGAYLSTGGAWTNASDRNAKQNVVPVDAREVLTHLARLPISTWNYKAEGPSMRHMGPMAQDFYAAFGLGQDNKHISTVDPDGVALAAIQGLHQIVKEKDAKISSLEARIEALESLADELVKSQARGEE